MICSHRCDRVRCGDMSMTSYGCHQSGMGALNSWSSAQSHLRLDRRTRVYEHGLELRERVCILFFTG